MNARADLYLAGMLAFACAGSVRRLAIAGVLKLISLCSYMEAIFNCTIILDETCSSLMAIACATVILLELLDKLGIKGRLAIEATRLTRWTSACGLTRPGRAARIVCAALTAFGFALVMATRTLALGHPVATAAALCVPLSAMLIFAMRIAKEHEQGVLGALLLCALCAAAMLARVSFLERSSGDYDIYLADWLQKLAGGSFAEGMRQNIGEYNVLYQYILFIITRLSVPSLNAVKAVSFIGDAFLAGAAAALAQKDGKKSMAAFGLALLLPTIVLNGGMFAQCDSLYAACGVGTGACAGRKARARGGEFCAVAGV